MNDDYEHFSDLQAEQEQADRDEQRWQDEQTND